MSVALGKIPSTSFPSDQKVLSYITSVFEKSQLTSSIIKKLTTPIAFVEFKASLTDESANAYNNNYYKIIGYKVERYALVEYIMNKINPDRQYGLNVDTLTKIRNKIDEKQLGKFDDSLSANTTIGQLIKLNFGNVVTYGAPVSRKQQDTSRDLYIKVIKEAFEGFCGCVVKVLWDLGIPVGVSIEAGRRVANYFFKGITISTEDLYDPLTKLGELYRNWMWDTVEDNFKLKKPDEVPPGLKKGETYENELMLFGYPPRKFIEQRGRPKGETRGQKVLLASKKYTVPMIEGKPVLAKVLTKNQSGQNPWVTELKKQVCKIALDTLGREYGIFPKEKKTDRSNIKTENNSSVDPGEVKDFMRRIFQRSKVEEDIFKDIFKSDFGTYVNALTQSNELQYFEFLGDLVANLVCALVLAKYYPIYQNPQFTASFHTASTEITGTRGFYQISVNIGLNKIIPSALLKGLPIEAIKGTITQKSIFEDVLESFVGVFSETIRKKYGICLSFQYTYQFMEYAILKSNIDLSNPISDLKSLYDRLPPFDPNIPKDQRALVWSDPSQGMYELLHPDKVSFLLRVGVPLSDEPLQIGFDKGVYYVGVNAWNKGYKSLPGWRKLNRRKSTHNFESASPRSYEGLEVNPRNKQTIAMIKIIGAPEYNINRLIKIKEVKRKVSEIALQIIDKKYRYLRDLAAQVKTVKQILYGMD